MKFYTDHAKVVRYHGSVVNRTADRLSNFMAAVFIAGIIMALLWMIVLTAASGKV